MDLTRKYKDVLNWKMILSFVLMASIGTVSSSAQSIKKKAVSDKSQFTLEDKIMDKVLDIPEVKEEAKYVENKSNGKRHLSDVICQRPTKKEPYYQVKVWEDNGVSYATYFIFLVNPKTLSIKYYDTVNDTAVDLAYWRKHRKK